MKKCILLIMCIISICITILSVWDTYSRYEEQAIGNFQSSVGKWNIKINNKDIVNINTYDFIIDNITILGNGNVVTGKFAPGLSGYFDINIDPSNTDVSVRYDLHIHTENLENSEIKVVNVYELSGNELIQTSKDVYTGIILLEDVKQGKQNTIRIEVEWDSEDETIEEDLEFANSVNNVLQLPLTMNITQYLGEELKTYN